EELGRIDARGISDVIVAYDPDRIVLDGGVVHGNEGLLIPAIRKYVDRFLPVPEIVVSTLGGDAPLLGASIIARGYETAIGSLIP
ncbi:MAG: ROK family protein, partial [Methanoregulaceae archaeon]|nr:ROK family protein [Methanoregulaceae archaeon]